MVLTFIDENMVMLSGTIQLLLQEQKAQDSDGAPRRSEWREHVERLMIRLGGVYTRAMLSILVGESWMDLLVSETTLPLRERLAIALLFLPDDEVCLAAPVNTQASLMLCSVIQVLPFARGRHESWRRYRSITYYWPQPCRA